MSLSERIAEQIEKLPPVMKAFLDRQLTAGNELIDVEIGRGPEAGRVALVMNHPFKFKPENLPEGLLYRTFEERDPMIFEYYTPDEAWSLLTAKFKPMRFDKITGPPDPMPAHLNRMRAIHEREEANAKTRAEAASKPVKYEPNPDVGEAANEFLESMKMTFDMWHDGTGYNLDALAKVPENERKTIEAILLRHDPVDWRDIEALSRFDSPEAHAAVVAALKHPDPDVRRQAMNYAPQEIEEGDREQLLLNALKSDDLFGGLSQAIDEAAEFHPPAVVAALINGCRNRPGPTAIHFSALLYFIYGKSKEPFDWDFRPFFLRFDADTLADRKAVFAEMCETIGVDPSEYR